MELRFIGIYYNQAPVPENLSLVSNIIHIYLEITSSLLRKLSININKILLEILYLSTTTSNSKMIISVATINFTLLLIRINSDLFTFTVKYLPTKRLPSNLQPAIRI